MGTPPPTHWGLWVGRSVCVCVCVCADGVRTLGQCPDYTQISFGNSSLLLLSFTPPRLRLFFLCSSSSSSLHPSLFPLNIIHLFLFLENNVIRTQFDILYVHYELLWSSFMFAHVHGCIILINGHFFWYHVHHFGGFILLTFEKTKNADKSCDKIRIKVWTILIILSLFLFPDVTFWEFYITSSQRTHFVLNIANITITKTGSSLYYSHFLSKMEEILGLFLSWGSKCNFNVKEKIKGAFLLYLYSCTTAEVSNRAFHHRHTCHQSICFYLYGKCW